MQKLKCKNQNKFKIPISTAPGPVVHRLFKNAPWPVIANTPQAYEVENAPTGVPSLGRSPRRPPRDDIKKRKKYF